MATATTENRALIVLACCVAAIGGFLFGFDSGVINGTVDGLQQAFNSTSIGTGFNVASMLLGCALGAFFAGRLADVYGRRTLLQVTALFFLLSAWGSGVAASSLEFVIYRILGGLAVGAASVLAPAYISEITPARFRGAMTSVQQIAIITGLFMAFVSNYLLAGMAGSASADFWLGFATWRWMFWVEMLPAGLFFLALLLIPESPRYLVMHQQQARASQVLARLFGQSSAAALVKDIGQSLAKDHQPRLSDLIDRRRRRLRTIVWVGIGLASFQQFVGINVVFYYGAVLWQAAGFTEADALLINVVSGGLSIIACAITIATIDRIGRRPLLVVGSVGMALTLGLMAVTFGGADYSAETGRLALTGTEGVIALAAANAYVFLFNMTWGPVMWVMLGEMFPNQLRGSGLAVAGLCQWLSNFAITMTFPMLLAGLGLAAAYGLYTLGALLSILFVLKMVHETRGLTLEQMKG